MGDRKLISIVTPLYNESENVDELARQLTAMFDENPAYDFEVIAVENGSSDDTYDMLLALRGRDPRFKILRLARNFRMDGGLTAGLRYVKGDAAVVMTADLQDPPHLITDFISKWEEGYENVFMVVTRREGTGLLRRMNSQLFYWVVTARSTRPSTRWTNATAWSAACSTGSVSAPPASRTSVRRGSPASRRPTPSR
jgi:glycosyltransferase involved in cell wall biosynthesis